MTGEERKALSRLGLVQRAFHTVTVHAKRILVQHRVELDELRARLDALENVDTSARRKLIALSDVAPRSGRRSTLPEHTGSENVRSRLRGTYCGVWKSGTETETGQLWTDRGSLWHVDADTTARPGDDPESWTLAATGGKGARLPG